MLHGLLNVLIYLLKHIGCFQNNHLNIQAEGYNNAQIARDNSNILRTI